MLIYFEIGIQQQMQEVPINQLDPKMIKEFNKYLKILYPKGSQVDAAYNENLVTEYDPYRNPINPKSTEKIDPQKLELHLAWYKSVVMAYKFDSYSIEEEAILDIATEHRVKAIDRDFTNSPLITSEEKGEIESYLSDFSKFTEVVDGMSKSVNSKFKVEVDGESGAMTLTEKKLFGKKAVLNWPDGKLIGVERRR